MPVIPSVSSARGLLKPNAKTSSANASRSLHHENSLSAMLVSYAHVFSLSAIDPSHSNPFRGIKMTMKTKLNERTRGKRRNKLKQKKKKNRDLIESVIYVTEKCELFIISQKMIMKMKKRMRRWYFSLDICSFLAYLFPLRFTFLASSTLWCPTFSSLCIHVVHTFNFRKILLNIAHRINSLAEDTTSSDNGWTRRLLTLPPAS